MPQSFGATVTGAKEQTEQEEDNLCLCSITLPKGGISTYVTNVIPRAHTTNIVPHGPFSSPGSFYPNGEHILPSLLPPSPPPPPHITSSQLSYSPSQAVFPLSLVPVMVMMSFASQEKQYS